jgi:hypothetical protein
MSLPVDVTTPGPGVRAGSSAGLWSFDPLSRNLAKQTSMGDPEPQTLAASTSKGNMEVSAE